MSELHEIKNVFAGLQTLYETHFNQRLSLEILKELSELDEVVEITGDYTGGVTGRGASHEKRHSKEFH